MNDNKFKVDYQRRSLMKGLAAVTLASSVMPGSLFAAGRGPTAVIIGAGIAGLSAAWDLRKAGFQVSIFEKEEFFDGLEEEILKENLDNIILDLKSRGIITDNEN